MKSIFALFDTYADVQAAVNSLLERDFSESDMAVMIPEEVARNSLDAAKSGEAGGQTARGLDHLIGGQNAVALPEVGRVYAAGDLATLLVDAAAAPGGRGLQDALHSLAIPERWPKRSRKPRQRQDPVRHQGGGRPRRVCAGRLIMRGRHTGSYNGALAPCWVRSPGAALSCPPHRGTQCHNAGRVAGSVCRPANAKPAECPIRPLKPHTLVPTAAPSGEHGIRGDA